MMRSLRFAVFSALMLAAPAAIAKPLIIDHRDNGNHYVHSERVPSDYRHGYGWTPVVYGFNTSKIRVGEDMIIRGARFTPSIRVFLGGEEIKASITPTHIRFTVPYGTPDGALVLRVPGLPRALVLGNVEVLGRWEHSGFRAWTPAKHELQLYRVRMGNILEMIELARDQGRDEMLARLREARRAEIERHSKVMDRLWLQYFARR